MASVQQFRMSSSISIAAFGSNDITTRMREIAFPSLLGKAIAPTRVADAVVRGIENRSARVMVPRRWVPFSALRGVLNPVTDLIAERHPELRRLLRRLEESAGPTDKSPQTNSPR